MTAQVFILGGRHVGRSFTVEESARMGRSSECEIPLHDRSISRIHARLVLEDGIWFLEDRESRNGVRHKGQRVKRVEVADRDEFLLGELPIRVCIGQPSEEAHEEREELEFVDQVQAAVPAPAPLEDEIDLEDDFEDEIEVGQPRKPHEAERSAYEMRRREILKSESGRGFLRGDLSQQPLWKVGLAFLIVLAFFAAMAYFAFKGVAMLRS